MTLEYSPSTEEQQEFQERYEAAVIEEAKVPVRMVKHKGSLVPVAWAPQEGSQTYLLQCRVFEALYHGTRGPGKCLALDEPVLTTDGWVRAGDITHSHTLIAGDGTPTRLLGIYPNEQVEMRRVTFHDGTEILACKDHRWQSCSTSNGIWRVRTTDEMMLAREGHVVPYMEGAIPGAQWHGPDPYMCGLLLGDGTLSEKCSHVALYSQDQEILDYVSKTHGWTVYHYEGCVPRLGCPASQDELWRSTLGTHVGREKRVPHELLWADPDTRLALLQGLMDSDGSIDPEGRCGFTSVSEHLADAVLHLVFSLGGRGTKTFDDRPPTGISEGELGGRWRVRLSSLNKFSLFRLTRKADRQRVIRKKLTRGIKSIEPAGVADGVCFAVEHPSHTFITTNWVVTHNTDALIMSFAQHVGKGYGAAWRGIIFRQTYPQLADVQAKTEKWFRLIFGNSAKFNKSKMMWEWDTGEVLMLRHMNSPSDYWNYHGHEYPFIGWEELCNWSSDECYKSMFSCCRSSTPGVPRMIRATTNPYGPGHHWVKERWRLHGEWWKYLFITDAVDTEGRPEPARCAIYGFIDENQILLTADPSYKSTIIASASNPAMGKAWLYGSWNIVAGGMFGDVWDPRLHIVQRFVVPPNWRIDRSFDWGSSKPFSVGWWAESDGSDVQLPDGSWISTVRGDLFRMAEWYGYNGKANQGLYYLATDITKGIVEREIKWGIDGRVKAGPADAAIFNAENGNCIATDMAKPVKLDNGVMHKGVQWTPSDKRPGSRKTGWEQIRKALKNARRPKAGPREHPGLFVMQGCDQFLRTFPTLPRDEKDMDDVDTTSEDHIGDEVRYRVRFMNVKVGNTTTIGHY